jgi:hypothetical protein
MAKTNADLIWKIAGPAGGPYPPHQYGDVTLRFTILRAACLVEPTKESKFKLPF